ncbi:MULTISPECIES: restriction endonuclease subunit S [Bacteroides]|uniref:restriction endonuclease subunit S n=1 Tax=Bacteroides TaxID=816 RepID=UPI0015EFC07E|nr:MULTISPECIES: restriction endonuclease subunit S [Bacteroides]QMI80866.1 restriction endonuclease subunit S [Bacteroides sp. CACC 737]QUT77491.1 Type I restriction modification DNA specificity domain protein [Bacteroides salyersiae]
MAIDNKDKKVLKSSIEREQNEVACSAECEKIKGSKNLNVPHLRFPEFSGEWKKCIIQDYGEVITGNTPPTNNAEYYNNGSYLWASPADLGTGKKINDTKTKLSESGFKKTRIIPKGSILVTCIGSTIGKMGMAVETMSSNQQINSIIVNEKSNNDFVYYAISRAFPRYLSEVGVQAVPILSKSNFEKLPNYTTSIEEQDKTGYFLNLLDERIATQNKIIDKLQSLIRGIAQNIARNNQPNVLLSECLECSSSTLQESDICENGTYPVYGANGIVGYFDDYSTEDEAVYIIKDGSGVGTVSYVTGKCSATGTLNTLQAKDGYLLQYLYYMLKVFNFEPYKTGMAIPHIYFKDYGKAKIFCPSYTEQLKYVELLSAIDNKLSVEQRILTNLSLQKQYLLRQMFI